MITQNIMPFLMSEIKFVIITSIIATIVIALSVIVGIINKHDKSYFIVCVSFMLVLLVACSIYVTPFIQDVSSESYIEYIGDFCIVDIYRGKGTGYRALVMFSEDDKIIQYDLYTDVDERLQEGWYNGKIIYSKKSRVIFEWEINKK